MVKELLTEVLKQNAGYEDNVTICHYASNI